MIQEELREIKEFTRLNLYQYRVFSILSFLSSLLFGIACIRIGRDLMSLPFLALAIFFSWLPLCFKWEGDWYEG